MSQQRGSEIEEPAADVEPVRAEDLLRARYPGCPKQRPCPRCDRPRLATHPGDRLHDACRESIEGDGETYGVALRGWGEV